MKEQRNLRFPGLATLIFMLWIATAPLHAAGGQNLAPPPPPALPPQPAMAVPQESMIYNFNDNEGWLGARLADVTPDRAKDLKLPGEYGAMVVEVEPNSPASKAGLEANDVILEFAGERVWSVAQLARWVRETPPGRAADLTIFRNGNRRELKVTIESRRNAFAFNGPYKIQTPKFTVPQFDLRIFSRGGMLGISGDDLTSQLADYFGVKEGKGVLVREVLKDSAAEKAGLKAGDVIVKLNDKPVASVVELRSRLDSLPGGTQKVTVTIVRNHREQTLPVEIESNQYTPTRSADMMEMLGVNPAQLAKILAQDQARLAKTQQYLEQQERNQLERNQATWKAQMEKAQQEMLKARRLYKEELRKQLLLRRRLVDSTII